MHTYINTAFIDTTEIIDIAQAADELGYDGLGIPDHVINLAELDTPYPYTPDGRRRWPAFTDWPDPWVLIGALAQCTTHLRFVTTVYVAPLRDPYNAAKTIGTAAVLSGGRLELGLGVGWCREEFDLMGAPFDKRGKRTEEMIALMRELWSPGWTQFDGEFYHTPKLEMTPTPPPIPILFGGQSDIAYRRAAAHDGWIGDIFTIDQATQIAAKLARIREDMGRSLDGFQFHTALVDAVNPDDMDRTERGGVTAVITQPWMFYHGPDTTLAQKIDGMVRYCKQFDIEVDHAH
ncbi:LLM class F420-dependent oxidoreductase [Mycobacterium kubicae]|uniref:LLM class F420-dependent oxidoreductase n=1 Tax=Mycobacterium kubicae TaxID=120959 RepID=A0AAX1JCG8_9MYCO|nr:TIGR03619 family F420-dependent LLM class oxidoreductase [Mycobacterium kubicae]MCV7094275.1 TIGR03619 family F420-dependent LLM class oxidoreductase [Mycobacterium kubicae]ORV98931.1 LLM class F420-dependent oxidoreductase [Mycobacterium kubicae]QNI09919.1 TIGR03619 family F420-dependent LLM class oxidoreductase [Mycobacterium kubicae]QPI38115.1 TIGR03619 family F420-dependent LLM class oxidoreductase [Mycobacterium kubicae]GFG65534.1 LLM class F420-dependent oxidoreductase [Mycobacterium 